MNNIVNLWEWKAERDGGELGRLIREYHLTQKEYREAMVSRETCHCYFADKYGYKLCEECPANDQSV